MAYVITDNCIKDELCVEVCPTDCIHPKKDDPKFEAETQLYIDPAGCIDCGACIPACTSDSDCWESPRSRQPRRASCNSSARRSGSPRGRFNPSWGRCSKARGNSCRAISSRSWSAWCSSRKPLASGRCWTDGTGGSPPDPGGRGDGAPQDHTPPFSGLGDRQLQHEGHE